ncbi:hypothetical protein DPSP01_003234 [Paraphaeosphaeria sporulosa]
MTNTEARNLIAVSISQRTMYPQLSWRYRSQRTSCSSRYCHRNTSFARFGDNMVLFALQTTIIASAHILLGNAMGGRSHAIDSLRKKARACESKNENVRIVCSEASWLDGD